jgi:hypothetical protein
MIPEEPKDKPQSPPEELETDDEPIDLERPIEPGDPNGQTT